MKSVDVPGKERAPDQKNKSRLRARQSTAGGHGQTRVMMSRSVLSSSAATTATTGSAAATPRPPPRRRSQSIQPSSQPRNTSYGVHAPRLSLFESRSVSRMFTCFCPACALFVMLELCLQTFKGSWESHYSQVHGKNKFSMGKIPRWVANFGLTSSAHTSIFADKTTTSFIF